MGRESWGRRVERNLCQRAKQGDGIDRTRVSCRPARQSPGGAHRGSEEVGADENTFQRRPGDNGARKDSNKAIGSLLTISREEDDLSWAIYL